MCSRSVPSNIAFIFLTLTGVMAAQDAYHERTLVVNGHTGTAMVYQISGKAYVDLETLARIGNGSIGFSGDKIIVTLSADASSDGHHSNQQAAPGMSNDFMKAALQDLSTLKEWSTALAYAIQRGVPGDGSRLVVFHDRATDQLRLAKVAASTEADENALRLLTNHFNTVSKWSDKLVAERKSMSTGKYSMTPNALANDETYQKITGCAQFLGTMLPSGQFHDDRTCN
jgi:hypothetical protein